MYYPYYSYDYGQINYMDPGMAPPTDIFTLLPNIEKAISNELKDEKFYDYMITEAPEEEDKDILVTIRNDKRKHRQMLKDIYQALSGRLPEIPKDVIFQRPKNYIDGLRQAILSESGVIDLQRQIYFQVPSETYKNTLFEILTDEFNHGLRYNYLYSKNKRR